MKRDKYFFLNFGKKDSIIVEFRSWNQVVRDIRKGHNLTQAQLGQILEFNYQQIARYESGQVEPPIQFWRRFSEYFKVNIAWLLFGEGAANEHRERPDPSVLSQLGTKELKQEVKKRERIILGYLTKMDEVRKRLLKERSAVSFEEIEKKIAEEQKQVIPYDAPAWLKTDVENELNSR
jgi:transcriptional regulator with XRE-family HTH domain